LLAADREHLHTIDPRCQIALYLADLQRPIGHALGLGELAQQDCAHRFDARQAILKGRDPVLRRIFTKPNQRCRETRVVAHFQI
jgi:hypothetical protein